MLQELKKKNDKSKEQKGERKEEKKEFRKTKIQDEEMKRLFAQSTKIAI